MRRPIIGLLVLALAAVLGRAEDRTAKEGAAAFKELKKEVEELAAKAATPDELERALKKYSPKVLALAEKHRKAPFAFDALALCLQMSMAEAPTNSPAAKAIAILKEDFVKHKRIEDVLPLLQEITAKGSADLLAAISEKNPTKKVQARAIKALILLRNKLVMEADRIQGDKKERKELADRRGNAYVKELEANAGKYRKEMLALDKKLQDRYPGMVKVLFIGKKAPEAVSQNLDGKKVKLSSLKGKVVVLHFWTTLSGPCVAMIPHERDLVKRLKGKPFVLVSISADARKETLANFLEDNAMPWTHWWNGGAKGGLVEDWEVTQFPTIYVLDAKGVIRYKDVRGKAMDRAVLALLKETKKGKK
jgi:thiol-disulfide isomerase/thioredoxin